MLTYEVDGTILKLMLKGTPSEGQRSLVHAEIASDPRVPLGALVLIDITRADPIEDIAEIERRTRLRTDQGGLRVALFRDEPTARQWLATFEAQ